MAREAKAAGAVHWTGMGGEEELEALVATGARTYGLLYFPSRRRDFLPPGFFAYPLIPGTGTKERLYPESQNPGLDFSGDFPDNKVNRNRD